MLSEKSVARKSSAVLSLNPPTLRSLNNVWICRPPVFPFWTDLIKFPIPTSSDHPDNTNIKHNGRAGLPGEAVNQVQQQEKELV